ncbi:unnamed protein product [Umbelopsis vinacea]
MSFTLETSLANHILNGFFENASYVQGFEASEADKKHIAAVNGLTAKTAVATSAAAEEEDDDIDLFGSDDEEVDEEAERVKAQRLAEYAAKKANKPKTIAKTTVSLDVKPWDDETNMEELTAAVKAIEMDGLIWGGSQLVPIGYGIKKLQINCVVEDDKVMLDDLSDKITELEDYVHDKRYQLVDDILGATSYYTVLGVARQSSAEEIRRAYIKRSRICHPDKFVPPYDKATEAFQRLSLAYETLSDSSSKIIYDISGPSSRPSFADAATVDGNETLQALLKQLFVEMMDGEFNTMRSFMIGLSRSNPSIQFTEETIVSIEISLRRVREMILSTKKYFKVVQFELMRLYELQHELRALSYFDLMRRMRLTITMFKVILSLPIMINLVSKGQIAAPPSCGTCSEPRPTASTSTASTSSSTDPESSTNNDGGILGDRIESALRVAVGFLDVLSSN